MKELSVTIRLHNNRLLERREMLGLSQEALAEKVGMNQSKYSKLERLAYSPVDSRTGQWTAVALKLAAFWGEPPEELFPESLRGVNVAAARKKYNVNEVELLMSGDTLRRITAPDEICEQKERTVFAREAMLKLSVKHRFVLESTYGTSTGETMKDSEIAEALGVSIQSVQSMRERALNCVRRLMHRLISPEKRRELKTKNAWAWGGSVYKKAREERKKEEEES